MIAILNLKQQISIYSHSLDDLIYSNVLKTFTYSKDLQSHISYPELTHELLVDISNWLSLRCLIDISNLPCPKLNSWFPSESFLSCSHPTEVHGQSIFPVGPGKSLDCPCLYLFLSYLVYNLSANSFGLKHVFSPGWCGSVDWVLACCQLDFQSRHMSGLRTRSPGGGHRETTSHWCFFPSLSPSLLLCIKINK